MVEIFKTNVQHTDESHMIVEKLLVHYPANKINFDLSDCDRILRVEGEEICPETIVAFVVAKGFQCEVLF